MRALRIERNLSLEGLAAASGDHHFTWVQKVEKDQINLKLSDLRALADALGVTPGYLVSGHYEDSEFMARLRGYESGLDERGRRAVLATAEREVEEAMAEKLEQAARAIRSLVEEGGYPLEDAQRAVAAMLGIDPPSDAAAAGA